MIKGLLIGLILGIGLSLGVALFIKGGESPFVAKVTPSPEIVTTPTEPSAAAKPAAPPADAAPGKPRFDFYTILPGKEAPVTEQEAQQSISAQDSAKGGTPKSYFLQVGAFQNEADADNLKARLALLGLEALVQTANLPDKGVSHRVRVGPLTDIEQIRTVRTELARNGFDAFLIEQNSAIPDHP